MVYTASSRSVVLRHHQTRHCSACWDIVQIGQAGFDLTHRKHKVNTRTYMWSQLSFFSFFTYVVTLIDSTGPKITLFAYYVSTYLSHYFGTCFFERKLCRQVLISTQVPCVIYSVQIRNNHSFLSSCPARAAMSRGYVLASAAGYGFAAGGRAAVNTLSAPPRAGRRARLPSSAIADTQRTTHHTGVRKYSFSYRVFYLGGCGCVCLLGQRYSKFSCEMS